MLKEGYSMQRKEKTEVGRRMGKKEGEKEVTMSCLPDKD